MMYLLALCVLLLATTQGWASSINNPPAAGVTSIVAGTAITISGPIGAVTVTNAGVTSNIAGTGISVSGATGAVTITNTGVTSLTGTVNQVTVSAATGAVTLSLPQDIATTSTPTFGGLTLNGTLAMGVNSITGTGAVNAGASGFISTNTAKTVTLLHDGTNASLQTSSGVVLSGHVYWTSGSLNAEYNTNATAPMEINNVGYLAGATQFRDFRVWDGKQAVVMTFLGSTSAVTGPTSLTMGTGKTIPVNTTALSSTGFSLTGSSALSMVSLTGTLNTSGNPDVWLLSLTNTASGATTKAMNVKVGGSSVFSVGMAGTVAIGNTVNTVTATLPNRTITMVIGGSTFYLHAKTTND